MHAHKNFVCAILAQNAVCTCCAYVVVWKRVCVKWLARTVTYVIAKDGDTDKGAQVWRDSLISLSHSSFAVRCAGVSAFCFPIVRVLGLIAIVTTHCTVHHHARTRAQAWHGLTACQHGHVQRIRIMWMGRTRNGRSVDARVPVDHASVGFAQACPKNDKYIFTP